VVCLPECDLKPHQLGGLGPLRILSHEKKLVDNVQFNFKLPYVHVSLK